MTKTFKRAEIEKDIERSEEKGPVNFKGLKRNELKGDLVGGARGLEPDDLVGGAK